MDIAKSFGGAGAMIFEVANNQGTEQVITPYYSENYDPEAVKIYFHHFNSLEIEDQWNFAEHSGTTHKINLVDDIEFIKQGEVFENRPNIQALKAHGFKHRSGSLLNKDSWQIDRFAVQYGDERGPSTSQEKQIASIILPHVAKALRIGRPLIHAKKDDPEFIKRMNKQSFGVAILDRNEQTIFSNTEFDRIVDSHPIFTKDSHGKLLLKDHDNTARYRSLITQQSVHAAQGAYPRRESLTFELGDTYTALFVEICPASDHPEVGNLPAGSRLITVLDTSLKHDVNGEIVTRFFPLTKTEKDVLSLVAQGFSNAEIAELRFRSIETINTQTKTILRKTLTRNRTELVQLSLSLNSPFSMDWLV